MKLKLLSMLAGASLFASAAQAADSVTYTFLDQDGAFFDMRSSTITSPTTITPTACLLMLACSTVKFNPTSAYDQITLTNGENYFFASTAFATPGYYQALNLPGSAGKNASFSTQIVRAVSAAPEPAAWTLMMVGAGLAGYALRRSRKGGQFAAKAVAA